MSSGFGLNGGRSRCFPFWQEFAYCYAKTTSDPRIACMAPYEDYKECMYHKKEKLRAVIVKTEVKRHKAEVAKEEASTSTRPPFTTPPEAKTH